MLNTLEAVALSNYMDNGQFRLAYDSGDSTETVSN
jgi:hypothetical protein